MEMISSTTPDVLDAGHRRGPSLARDLDGEARPGVLGGRGDTNLDVPGSAIDLCHLLNSVSSVMSVVGIGNRLADEPIKRVDDHPLIDQLHDDHLSGLNTMATSIVSNGRPSDTALRRETRGWSPCPRAASEAQVRALSQARSPPSRPLDENASTGSKHLFPLPDGPGLPCAPRHARRDARTRALCLACPFIEGAKGPQRPREPA